MIFEEFFMWRKLLTTKKVTPSMGLPKTFILIGIHEFLLFLYMFLPSLIRDAANINKTKPDVFGEPLTIVTILYINEAIKKSIPTICSNKPI